MEDFLKTLEAIRQEYEDLAYEGKGGSVSFWNVAKQVAVSDFMDSVGAGGNPEWIGEKYEFDANEAQRKLEDETDPVFKNYWMVIMMQNTGAREAADRCMKLYLKSK